MEWGTSGEEKEKWSGGVKRRRWKRDKIQAGKEGKRWEGYEVRREIRRVSGKKMRQGGK